MSSSDKLDIDSEILGDVAKLTIRQALNDDHVCQIRKYIDKVLDDGYLHLGLDLTDVDYISSSGIGMLVSILKRCNRENVGFALCGLRFLTS